MDPIIFDKKTLKVETYEDAYQKYLENPKLWLGKRKFTDNLGITRTDNIVKAEFHLDNEPYLAFLEECKSLPAQLFEVSTDFISSSVYCGNGGTILRKHNRVRIDCSSGHFCVAPHNNGLEFCRIIANDRGKGNGTSMMKLFFLLVLDAGLDLATLPIMLECTGSVGAGSNQVTTNLTSQTKFFRKFGFRVNQSSSNYKGGYVQMNFQNNLVEEYKKSLSL